jgi:DNA-binding LacI/PurR family transcriptional regulator
MKEIAQEAGLSRFTVSKIFNGDLKVKSESREKVLAICDKHGYAPNNNAVGLAKGKTKMIGMIVPYITDDFYNEIIELTEELAVSKGYQLIYKSSYNDTEKEADVIKNFLALKVCALIIVPVVCNPNMHIHTLAAKHVPMIYLDRPLLKISKDMYTVLNDNEQSGYDMTEYLIKKKKTPAYMGSFYGETNISAALRRKGYLEAMKVHSKKALLIPAGFSSQKQDNEIYGYENMVHLLKNTSLPNAVFCVTDAVALGVSRAVREAGFVPGKDIAIAGHDNLRFSSYVTPSITTMKQPKSLLAKTCIEIADKLIRNQPVSKKKYIFPSVLIVRESA